VSLARSFDIESPANVSMDSSKIRCDIFNNILNESSTLRSELIGTRFRHLAENPVAYLKAQAREKTNLELMVELGLLGAIEDSEITSENHKEFIKKSFDKHYGKEN
jgi:hypothetical protein